MNDDTSAVRCGWCSYPLPGHALGCPNGPKPSTQVCEHGSLRRSCEICERDAEIAELRAERERLREALRRHDVTGIAFTRPPRMRCLRCGMEWLADNYAENHAPDCLAAPKEPKDV